MGWSITVMMAGWLASVALGGCAATTEPGQNIVQRVEGTTPAPPAATGFLAGDYALLRPGKEGQAALVYVNPDVPWRTYSKVLLEPVQFWAASGATVSAADQHVLTAYFYNVLAAQLGKTFTMVAEPGPGVMTVQVALNNATGAVPVLRSVSVLIPQARLLNFAQSLGTGSYAFVGSAEAEAKIVDSVTGQLLCAGADRRQGGMQIASAAQWQWGDAEKIMEYWATTISGRLQQLTTQGKLD